ncbi:MAG: hypothetical protein VX904_07235 [Planctomycetota bacterium]|nr:hypothetical protein [Planctomycetota bacterium]
MNQKKQQLQHNELADWLEVRIEELKPYASHIGIGVLVVVAVVGVGVYWLNDQEAKSGQAWADYSNAADTARYNGSVIALVDNAEDYPGTTAAWWSLQMAADINLRDGLAELYSDRKSDDSAISKALEQYTQVVEGTVQGSMLNNHAKLGQSIAYEAMGEVADALAGYETLVESSKDQAGLPTSPIGKLALKYHNRLSNFGGEQDGEEPAAKTFYDSFLAYTPSLQPPTIPGMGGLPTGGTGNDGLRKLPDLSFPDLAGPTSGEEGNGEGGETPPANTSDAQPDLGGGALKPPANAPESVDESDTKPNGDEEESEEESESPDQ